LAFRPRSTRRGSRPGHQLLDDLDGLGEHLVAYQREGEPETGGPLALLMLLGLILTAIGAGTMLRARRRAFR
jgi:hypothetical protein